MKKKIALIFVFVLVFALFVPAFVGASSTFTVNYYSSPDEQKTVTSDLSAPYMKSIDDTKGAVMSVLSALDSISNYNAVTKNSYVEQLVSLGYYHSVYANFIGVTVCVPYSFSGSGFSVFSLGGSDLSFSGNGLSTFGYSATPGVIKNESFDVVYTSPGYGDYILSRTDSYYPITYTVPDATISGVWEGVPYDPVAMLDSFTWMNEENKTALLEYFTSIEPGPDEDPEAIEPQVKFIWDDTVFNTIETTGTPSVTQGYYQIVDGTDLSAFVFMLQTGLYKDDTYTIEVSQFYEGETNVVGSYILNNVMTIEKNKVYTIRVPIQETWTIKSNFLSGVNGYLICRVYSNRTLNESSGCFCTGVASSNDRVTVGENTGGSTIDDVIGNEDNTVESTDKTFLQKIEDFFTKYVVDPFNYIAEKVIGIFKAITGIGSSFSSFIGNFLSFLPGDYLSILKAGLLLSIGLMIFKLIRG